ncbi:VOC family protein [Ideonella livida]|uniref:VOC family protein n=1 Tax=Ideonella livida TaxID=2707176 RepID=A0A7C9PFX1_9BURK|nr:VOC family protein [Ideonella livida]NDY90412.1 VOC family protein [Ideonella livida]
MQARLTVITLGVDDLERALRFYRDGLGWATPGIVGTQYPHGAVVFFELQPGLKLALWPRASLAADAGVPQGPRSATEMALAHNVATPREVEAVLAQAEAAGATVLKRPGPAFWGGWTAQFQDPDGHLWEIAHNPHWPVPVD